MLKGCIIPPHPLHPISHDRRGKLVSMARWYVHTSSARVVLRNVYEPSEEYSFAVKLYLSRSERVVAKSVPRLQVRTSPRARRRPIGFSTPTIPQAHLNC